MKTSGERAAVSDFGVGVPPRQEVRFADGTAVWLHHVIANGVPDLFRRAVGHPAGGHEVDLRKLAPTLAEDLPIASTRDVPGIVHYSLRSVFKSADQFHAASGGLVTSEGD